MVKIKVTEIYGDCKVTSVRGNEDSEFFWAVIKVYESLHNLANSQQMTLLFLSAMVRHITTEECEWAVCNEAEAGRQDRCIAAIKSALEMLDETVARNKAIDKAAVFIKSTAVPPGGN